MDRRITGGTNSDNANSTSHFDDDVVVLRERHRRLLCLGKMDEERKRMRVILCQVEDDAPNFMFNVKGDSSKLTILQPWAEYV
jgi:hypothetical protein